MVQKLRASKKGTALLALLIAVLTVVYLLVTSALAQEDNGTAKDSGKVYNRDYLSYGDIWAFDYTSSFFANDVKDDTSVEWYTNEPVDQQQSAPATSSAMLYRYYYKIDKIDITKANEEAVVGEHVITGKSQDTFFANEKQSTVTAENAAIGIPTIQVINKGEKARYTVVPQSKGEYTVYAYYTGGENPESITVHCGILDTAEKYNKFVNADEAGKTAVNLMPISAGSKWYSGKISVENTHWSAVTLSCQTANSTDRSESNTNTTNKSDEASTDDLVGLSGSFYYNKWTQTKVWFDTLLVFEFDSSVEMGPITKEDGITIQQDSNPQDSYTGTLDVKNVFGQEISVGEKTKTFHAPLVITTAPSDGSMFKGLDGGKRSAEEISGQKNVYRYNFEEPSELSAMWGEQVDLPSILVTVKSADGQADDAFGQIKMDFLVTTTMNNLTAYTEKYTYCFKLTDSEESSGNQKWTYLYSVDGGVEKTFENTFEVPVQYDTKAIKIIARNADKEYSAIFTANVADDNTTEEKSNIVAKIGSTYYYRIEDALMHAKDKDTIILLKDTSFCEEKRDSWSNNNVGYTVKSGVTLLVPNDSDASTITNAESKNLYEYIADLKTITPTEYRRLSLPKGVTLTVNGNLIVGGKWNAPGGGQIMKAISYGLIMMQEGSHISVEPSGKLYAWGYISGTLNQDRTKVAGEVTVKSGSTLYEIFQIQDFRGGTQTSGLLGKVFPINQYYIQNIEVPLKAHAGATETVATAMYAVSTTTATSLTLVGQNSGLFQLTGENASLLRSYNPARDRMTYTLNGETAIKSISLRLKVSVLSKTIDSADYYLPITSNMTIDVQSGNTKIESDVALLPGVEMNIAKDATTTVASGKTLFVYDADEWVNKGYAGANGKDMVSAPYSVANGTTPRRTNKNLVDAAVTVNGTLKADGNVCTSASGANITCGENGQLNIGVNGIQTSAILQAKAGEKIGTPHTAAQLKNADGSYSQTAGVKNATLTKGDEGTFIKTSTDGKQEQETVKLQVGTDPAKCYFTYAAAISSLGQSKSATLTALSESTETVAIDVGKTITIDVNGKKIGTIQNLSNMTIIGKGSIQSIQNTGAGSVTIPKESAVQVAGAINDGVTFSIAAGSFIGGIENKDGSKLVISDGTFAAELINQMGGTATISGGTFKGLNNRGTITLSRGKFDEVKNQGTITVTSPADVKIKSLPITGTLVDSKGTPLTLKKTADAEGYYSLTENTATIRFNCNGTKDGKTIATGETDEKKVRLVGSTVYAYPFTMTAENYSFKGWAKSADATETLFAADETKNATLDAQTLKENGATVGGTLNLYAVYQKEWSYKIIWNVDGKQVQETHWTDSMKEASYTLAADVTNAITEVKVTGPEESYTMTRRNRSVTLSGVKADLIVNITTGIEEGKPTYYMGEMSFQYYKNMAVFTNDGWKMLDNYTWRHKTGSVTHEVGENIYTVSNGDILLVNNSNRVYVYTIELAEKGAGFDWAHMEFLASGGTVTQSELDKIVVIVQPSAEVTVTGKMKGQTNDFSLTNASLGSISVSAAVLEN